MVVVWYGVTGREVVDGTEIDGLVGVDGGWILLVWMVCWVGEWRRLYEWVACVDG